MTKKTYQGSCHCGSVAFEAEIDPAKGTNRCNCSICTKARAWFIGIPAADLKMTKGEELMADYSWSPAGRKPFGLHYRFCPECGVRLFAEGQEKSLGGPFYAVAVAALDNLNAEDVDVLANGITYVDGAHENYGKDAPPPADTRLM